MIIFRPGEAAEAEKNISNELSHASSHEIYDKHKPALCMQAENAGKKYETGDGEEA